MSAPRVWGQGRTAFAWVSAMRSGQRLLQLVLVVLTFVTGLVDAVTYLEFGHVFAANMTGNVIVLGFALVGAGQISATGSIVSLAAFIVGAALSARLAAALQRARNRWLLTMLACETGVLLFAAVLCLKERAFASDLVIVGLLALAMGMRIVTARRLGVSDVSTTVITSTLAGLAADALVTGARLRAGGMRLAIVGAMLLGAVSGAVLLSYGAAVVLGFGASLLLVVTIGFVVAIYQHSGVGD